MSSANPERENLPRAEQASAPSNCSPALPPLEGHLREILGMMIFNTGAIGRRLDYLGLYKVERRAEAEQAAALHWMLNLYLAHGDQWAVVGQKILKGEAQENVRVSGGTNNL